MGDTIPDFAFTDLDGRAHQLSEFRGKHILLDFWGTWCGPCRRKLPDLEKAYQQFRSRGLVVLGMGDDVDVEEARKVLSKAGLTFPQSSGETGRALVYKRFRINRLPSLALLDGTGKVIVEDTDGAFRGERLFATLDGLLSGKR